MKVKTKAEQKLKKTWSERWAIAFVLAVWTIDNPVARLARRYARAARVATKLIRQTRSWRNETKQKISNTKSKLSLRCNIHKKKRRENFNEVSSLGKQITKQSGAQ